MSDDLRKRLRELRVFEPDLPPFDADAAPEDPAELFREWLEHAIDAGVRAPHAMTLSTMDGYARPDSRILLLKGLDDGRWQFASSRNSRKGQQLANTPWAALNFHWPEIGRQVRVRGRVADPRPEDAARDFLERPEASRAESLPGRQSQPLSDPAELEAAGEEAAKKVAEQPDLVPDHWALYNLIPDEVEFWQGDPNRRHIRLRYRSSGGRWTRGRLWP